MSLNNEFDSLDELINNLVRRIDELDKKYIEIKSILYDIVKILRNISSILKNINKTVEDTNMEVKKLRRTSEEHDRRLNTLTKDMKFVKNKLEEHDRRLDTISKDVRDIKITIRRFVYDLEDEALEAVAYFLEKLFGLKFRLNVLEVSGFVEINIFGERPEALVMGESKNRVRVSTIKEILAKVLKYYGYRREIEKKRLILVLYGISYLESAVELARRYGIGVFTSRRIIVEPKFLTIDKIKSIYEEIQRL